MYYISLFFKFIFFIIILVFALINLDHVNIRLWHNLTIKDVPVIVVICISFFSGIIYHWLFTFPIVLKLKNQNSKLQKELKNISKN